MSFVTKNVSRYESEKGYNLSKLSRETGIPYGSLYASLCDDGRERDLRDDEFIKICLFVDANPMDFAGNPEQMEGM